MDRVINTPVTVTVASIKAVQPGKKMGAIYGIDGQRWGVWGNQLDKFVEGGVYKILSHKEGDFQGQTLKTVGDFEYIGAPTPSVQKEATAVRQRATIVTGGIPQAGAGSSSKVTNTTASVASFYAQGSDAENTRRRDIFVCGALNNYIGKADGWTEDGLVKFVECMKRVWEKTLGPNAKAETPPSYGSGGGGGSNRSGNDDMSDQIPDFGT